MAHTVKEFLER